MLRPSDLVLLASAKRHKAVLGGRVYGLTPAATRRLLEGGFVAWDYLVRGRDRHRMLVELRDMAAVDVQTLCRQDDWARLATVGRRIAELADLLGRRSLYLTIKGEEEVISFE